MTLKLANTLSLIPAESCHNVMVDSRKLFSANHKPAKIANDSGKKSNFLAKAWTKCGLFITKMLDRAEVKINLDTFLSDVRYVSKNLYRGTHTGVEGLRLLKKNKNIDVVINLKYETPENLKILKGEAEKLGMDYHNFSLNPFEYLDKKQVKKILAVIQEARKNGKNVYVHCLYGKDRTGTIIAMCRMMEGKSFEEAFSEMKAIGHRKRIFTKLKTFLLDFAAKPYELNPLEAHA